MISRAVRLLGQNERPILSLERTKQERRCAGIMQFRRKRRLSLRTALTENSVFDSLRHPLQVAKNWQLIVSIRHHASPVPHTVRYA